MLLVIDGADLRYIENAIIEAARKARDTGGNPVMIPTIDNRRLRQAAKIAMSLVCVEDILDGSETLIIKRPRRQAGFVDILED